MFRALGQQNSRMSKRKADEMEHAKPDPDAECVVCCELLDEFRDVHS
jgi:hypothetical protein